jgi:hypothetical protein
MDIYLKKINPKLSIISIGAVTNNKHTSQRLMFHNGNDGGTEREKNPNEKQSFFQQGETISLGSYSLCIGCVDFFLHRGNVSNC